MNICKKREKWKKAYFSKMFIAMLALLLNGQEGDNISTVQRTEAKKSEKATDRHADSPREIIIYYLLTQYLLLLFYSYMLYIGQGK